MLRAIVLGLCGLAIGAGPVVGDDELTCVVMQLDDPDEQGFAWFMIDRCPVSGGVPDCVSCYSDFEEFDVNGVAWPEFCPDCFSASRRRLTSSDRPLKRKIGVTQSLVDYLPRTTPGANGRLVSLPQRIRQSTVRDVQVESPSNGRVISIRLFDVTLLDAKGRTRFARFGLESDRPVQAGHRAFRAESGGGDAYSLTIIDRGRRYPVKTQTPLRDLEVAVPR